jgi:hypothetical protein
MSNWQPIETVPKDRTIVLLYLRGEGYHGPRQCNITAGLLTDSGYYAISDGYAGVVSDQPSHWMPLPDPPKE